MLQLRNELGQFLPPIKWWKELKMCHFDLESTGFYGDQDYIICWAVKEHDKSRVVTDSITQKEVISGAYDKRIMSSLYKELSKYDIITTYYGSVFDAKMFKTRCMVHGIEPFYVRQKFHIDIFWKVKTLLNLRRCSLKMACKFFGIKGKTELEIEYWKRAGLGDKAAMEKLLLHNRNDVIILNKLFNKIEPYCKFDKKGF